MIRMESIRLKAFSSSNRGKATSVKIELETSDPDALSWLLHELQEARTPKTPTPPAKVEEARLALPAPQLRLPAPKGGRRL